MVVILMYAKLAGFMISDKLSGLKDVKITVQGIVPENYQTIFQFLILV